jgi:hypothetical protein
MKFNNVYISENLGKVSGVSRGGDINFATVPKTNHKMLTKVPTASETMKINEFLKIWPPISFGCFVPLTSCDSPLFYLILP